MRKKREAARRVPDGFEIFEHVTYCVTAF